MQTRKTLLIRFCFAKDNATLEEAAKRFALYNHDKFCYSILLYLQLKKKQYDMNYTDKMLRDDALKGKVIVVTGGGSGLGKR
jgi:coproporphyrinogen III oxidase-like Fe-S oxidoreductase